MDFRVGSAPVKSYIHHATSPQDEITQSGYLNRKCLQDAGAKRSKDRSWQTLWCYLKGKTLEFYRVEGIRPKPNADPPPRDVYPPPNMVKYKAGFVNLEGGMVELDYTSQLNKDLQKRRKYLFRLQLPNAVEYLMQAPSDHQKTNWVIALQSAAQGPEAAEAEMEHVPLHQIKAARCSIKQRSRQNVHSVKVQHYKASSFEETDYVDSFERSMQGDVRLQLLRKRLQSKKELLRQLDRMYTCFVAGNGSMYCDMPVPNDHPHEVPVDRRLSLPDQILPTQNGCRDSGCHDDSDDRRSSTGELAVPILHRGSIAPEDLGNGIETELLVDYYITPGAPWSLLRKGEKVRVLARMASGWYRCIAMRDADYQLDPDPCTSSLSVVSGLSEISMDSGLHLNEGQTHREGEEEEEERGEGEGGDGDREVFQDEDDQQESVQPGISIPVPLRAKRRRSSLERPLSYQMATEEESHLFDYLPAAEKPEASPPSPSQSPSHARTHSPPILKRMSVDTSPSHPLHRSSLPSYLQQDTSFLQAYSSPSPKQARLSGLLEKELQGGRYSIPLVGCIPPSALRMFSNRPSSPASPSSPTSPPPTPSPPAQSRESNGVIPSQEHNGDMPMYEDTPILREDSLTVSSLEGSHSHRARSLPPPTIHHSPPPSPPKSPTPPPSPSLQEDHTHFPIHRARSSSPEPGAGKKAITSSLPAHTSHSVGSTPAHKIQHPSPTHRKGSKQRQDPANIQSLFNSGGGGGGGGGGSFLKRLFVKRKALKPQQQNGDVRLPSPISPPHPLLDDDFDPIERTRMSSVSGRPVRSTGVGLVFGEESSSEEEEEEEAEDDTASNVSPSSSLHEEPSALSPRHESMPPLLSRKLSDDTSGGVSPSPRLPKSASEHGSLQLASQATDQPQPTKPTVKKNSPFRMQSFKKQRSQSEQTSPKRTKMTKKKPRRSLETLTSSESLKVTGIFRQPPRGEKRFVYLDPHQPKHGFRLESYGRVSERGRILQTFVQSVDPGSSAFMAGLFPGDAILEVNGVGVKYAPVEKVVAAITRVPPGSREKIQLAVEFVDGVTRLELMKRADELKYEMRAKQTRLRDLVRAETHHLSTAVTLPTPRTLTVAHTLPPWGDTMPTDKPGPYPFPFNRRMNAVVSLYAGGVTQLISDALIMPLASAFKPETGRENMLYQLLKTGGKELLDELSLSKQCRLGENILTRGHNLPTTHIYHCVFGDLQESLLGCCHRALDSAAQEKERAIVFWMDGFAAISVVETVRLWLQEGLNSHKFERIVFCARANIPLLEEALEKYFPLLPFIHRVGPMQVEVDEEAPANDTVEDVDKESLENYEKHVDKEPPARYEEVHEEAPANYKEKAVGKEAPADYKEKDTDKEGPAKDVDEEAPTNYKEKAEANANYNEDMVKEPPVNFKDKGMDEEATANYKEKDMNEEAPANYNEKDINEEAPSNYNKKDMGKEAPANYKEKEVDSGDDRAETPVMKDSVNDTLTNRTNEEPVVRAGDSSGILDAAAVVTKALERVYPIVTAAPLSKQSSDIDLEDITLELDELERQAKQKLIELTQASPTPQLDPLLMGSEGVDLPEGELDPLEQVARDLMLQALQQTDAIPSNDPPVSAGDRRSSSADLVLNPERIESDV